MSRSGIAAAMVLAVCAACAGYGLSGASTAALASSRLPPRCTQRAPASLAGERWPAARKVLAPAGVIAIRLCHYAGVARRPRLALLGSQLIVTRGLVSELVGEFDRLPSQTAPISCPADDGSQILAVLAYPDGQVVRISVGLTGCELVANGSVHRTAAGFGTPPRFGPQLVAQLEQLVSRRHSSFTNHELSAGPPLKRPQLLSLQYGRFRPQGAPHPYFALKLSVRVPGGQVVETEVFDRPSGFAAVGDSECGLGGQKNGGVETSFMPVSFMPGMPRFRPGVHHVHVTVVASACNGTTATKQASRTFTLFVR